MDTRATTPTALIIRLEIIWWIVTAIIIAGVLFPLRNYLGDYPFLLTNILYIIVFITLTRYTFLLRFTLLAYRQTLKIVLIFLCIPLVFFLVQELNSFQTYLDYNGAEALLGETNFEISDSIVRYTYNEMLLFGVGSIISGVVFPFRLVLSVWRGRNRGTV